MAGGRGGRRPGAGRPKGSKGHRRLLVDTLSKAAQARKLPLDRLLERIEDEREPARYRDALCIAVLPYLHAKPSVNLTAKCSFEMSDDELNQVIAKEEAYARGELGSVVRFPAVGRGRR